MDEFEEFLFRVCTMNYLKMEVGMASLEKRRESADEIKIVGNGIDLSFSIKGIPAIPCGGHHNIPDGEVFTAPIKNSANGTIQYNPQQFIRVFRSKTLA
jgi:aminopeptidase